MQLLRYTENWDFLKAGSEEINGNSDMFVHIEETFTEFIIAGVIKPCLLSDQGGFIILLTILYRIMDYE